MGRLIDADALKKDILSQSILGETMGKVLDRYIHVVDSQPTVFDVDKVVDQLNDKFRVVRTDEDLEWNRAMDEAITIVKGGGVNAKTDS